jgi:kanosamine 6-kinase
MDIGGTKVAFRISGDGLPAYQATIPWPPRGELSRDLSVLAEAVGILLQRSPEPVEAVGVAMPATIDRAGRITTWPTRPRWAGLDLGALLSRLFRGAMVRWADDGDLAAIAEARASGCENLVYLGVGTGIGGGIALGGRRFPPGRGSCEIGHMVIDRSGPECDCGRQGCLQAVASGPVTLRRAAALRGTEVSFAELRLALAQSCEWATAAVSQTYAALATAVVSLDELIHPEQFVIGGGFAAELPDAAAMISEQVTGLLRAGQEALRVREALLGGLASLHGAELLARGLV